MIELIVRKLNRSRWLEKSSTLKKFDRAKVRFVRCDNDNEQDSVESGCIAVLSGRLFRIGGEGRRKMRKFYLSL